MTYNGWKNQVTFDAAVTIGNNEPVYLIALESKDFPDFKEKVKSHKFAETFEYDDLDEEELTNLIKGFKS